MKQKLKTGALYIGQILLTAMASAIIAMLQNWLATHTGTPTHQISPENTATIGGVISTGHMSFKAIKTQFLG